MCTDESEAEPYGHVASAASAVEAAVRRAAMSPVEFVQRVEKDGKNKGLIMPSSDFHRLCIEQLDLFRRIIHPNALLSVFVRPAGSYVMDQLELQRVAAYPGVNSAEIVILTGSFSIPTGLRAAESAILNQQADVIPEYRAVVFPMVKKPFVIGFLVAELPHTEFKTENYDIEPFPVVESSLPLPPYKDTKSWHIQLTKDKQFEACKFTADQRLNAINISRTLAMAYIMDQKALLLQQSSWQNNVRMNNLAEQIRGSLSSIRTLSKMLSLRLKRSEISYDIVEDILVQGDHMRDTLQQLQDAVYVTKANIMQYNDESLRKIHQSYAHPKSRQSQIYSNISSVNDLEVPMPPLALVALQQEDIRRPCNVSDILSDLVGAVEPLARKQQRGVELCELSHSLPVAVEEPALRQALSNLIEGALLRAQIGGEVKIVTTKAPAGGALVMIDDDGPDMHYMTQMHSLTPFGTDLFSKEMIEDNMTWNFIAGLAVAREILESYGCVVRVISPRITDTAAGLGGTRVELWLPSSSAADKT